MAWLELCLQRSRSASGDLVVRLGVPLLDRYLDFLAVRSRPNTVLAAAYDLKVFFTVVGKAPHEVTSADVLGFVTAQHTGGGLGRLQPVAQGALGVSAPTVRRRLSSVSGLFGFLLARGDVEANPVPRGLPTRRERQRPRQGVPLVRTPKTLPRILEPAAVDALLATLRTYRGRAMVEAMVLGGLRRCEVLGLRLGDLQVATRRVFIGEGKGGHQRLIPVSSRFFTSVASYLDSERSAEADTDRLFVVLLRAAQTQRRLLVRVVVEVLLRTGLRVGEFTALTRDAVVHIGAAPWLHVPVGKLHEDRYLPLHPHLVALVGDYRGKHVSPDNPLLLPRENGRPLDRHTVTRLINKAGAGAGLTHIHPHQLRHTLATQAINRGMSLEAIAAQLGHGSLDMTLRYAKIANRTVADEYFAVTEKVEALYGQKTALPADTIGPRMARLRREHHRLLGNGYARITCIMARFERMGWLRSRAEDIDESLAGRPARRYYEITPEGLAGARLAKAEIMAELSSQQDRTIPSFRPSPAGFRQLRSEGGIACTP